MRNRSFGKKIHYLKKEYPFKCPQCGREQWCEIWSIKKMLGHIHCYNADCGFEFEVKIEPCMIGFVIIGHGNKLPL
jgi:transcription elongation factor Elf1